MRFGNVALTTLVVASLAAGCSGRFTARSATRASSGFPGSTVVTATELARIVRQGSLIDAIEQVRPSLLASRGGTLLVSVDGSAASDLSILRMIAASDVFEVRRLRASSSVGRPMVLPNGDVVVADVILVTTKGASRRAQPDHR